MVRALVLLALGGNGPAGPAPCRVLCARSFGTPPPPPGTPRGPRPGTAPPPGADRGRGENAPYGVFQLPPGDPFPERVTVTWIQVVALALALVCDPQENLALAELTLRRLAPRFLASLRLLDPGANALLHPDAADGLLERLLPQGEMLFLNEGFIQGMDREMGIKRSR